MYTVVGHQGFLVRKQMLFCVIIVLIGSLKEFIDVWTRRVACLQIDISIVHRLHVLWREPHNVHNENLLQNEWVVCEIGYLQRQRIVFDCSKRPRCESYVVFFKIDQMVRPFM